MSPQFQKLTFKNATGENLSARLDLPMDEKPVAYALFAHCFTCSKSLNAVINISRALTARGIAVMRFDFTGLGESEGDFSDTTFSSNIQDLIAAAEFMADAYEGPALLIGHSLGGAAFLHAAPHIPWARAVATIAAPFYPEEFPYPNLKDKIMEEGSAEVSIGGRSFVIRRKFLEDLQKSRMEDVIRGLKKPLIVFQSPSDEVVNVNEGVKIFDAAQQPKSFISLDGADHLLSNKEDSRYVGSVIGAWFEKYSSREEETESDDHGQARGIVTRIGKFGFRTEIVSGKHRLVADEPIAMGGSDTGPNPYDLLTAALGACTCMTLRMFADRKGWPLESVTARLEHRKIHAEDCRDCETKEGKIDVIDIEVDPTGNLSAEQRQRLLEISGRCPVHRTLHSELSIRSRLKEQ